MLLAMVAIFLALLYPNLVVRQPVYNLGDIADRDIKAPQDFFVEDKTATAANQQQAADQVLAVYDFDPRIAPQIVERVRTAFAGMRKIMADTAGQQATASGTKSAANDENIQREIENALMIQREEFENLMGIEISRGALKLLASEAFSPALAETIARILETILANGVVANKDLLLKEVDKGVTLRDVSNQTEKTVYSLRSYYGPDQAKTMVRIVAEPLVKDMNYNLVNLVVDLSQRLVQPNISLNRNETEERKKQALAEIKPIMYKIKAGEMLLREGERVSTLQLLKLRALEAQNEDKRISTTGVGTAILLITVLIVIYFLCFSQPRFVRLESTKNLLFLTLVLILVVLMAKIGAQLSTAKIAMPVLNVSVDAVIFAAPLSSGAMLVCLVLGFAMAMPFALISAICAALLFGARLDIFLFFLVSNAMAAYWVQHCRERKVVIAAGLKVGVLNFITALAIGFFTAGTGAQLAWNEIGRAHV
jgi:membrane-associated HD superfamily phosphohydrolase